MLKLVFQKLDPYVSGNLRICLKEVKPLVVYDLECGRLCTQCRQTGLHVEFIFGTPRYFAFLQCHQCLSRLLTVFLVTLWSSIKQIKAPYMFDEEHGVALHTMQGNWASFHGEGEVL